MNILIFGKDGQLGLAFKSIFVSKKMDDLHRIYYLGRSDCDLTGPTAILKILNQCNPKLIINTAAYTAVDQAQTEDDLAFVINAKAPAVMARYALENGATFLHYSTDYVFDGSKQPNLPDDVKNPLQNYGISKLISEYRVIKNCKKYCIIRTPVLYSSLCQIHDNAVCVIGKNIMDLRNNKTFREDNYCIRRPLYIYDLCHFINDCIKNNFIGIYHFYNPYNKFTKYDISKMIGDVLGIQINNIIPNNSSSEGVAPRPYDTHLIDIKYNIQNYNFNNFNETIVKCFEKFKHSKITYENKNDFFICLDMDGTIIETNSAHYNSYKKTFETNNKTFLNIEEWNVIIMNNNIDNYLKSIFDKEEIFNIKKEKLEFLKEELILFTKNSEIFLKFLIENDFNFCIVTNTNKETVEIFKEKLPLLNEIKQWIYRGDYKLAKPYGECYEVAKKKYYKNEKYIIGIEDSVVGYTALKQHTDLIYIYNNELLFKNNDCYLFDDYSYFL